MNLYCKNINQWSFQMNSLARINFHWPELNRGWGLGLSNGETKTCVTLITKTISNTWRHGLIIFSVFFINFILTPYEPTNKITEKRRKRPNVRKTPLLSSPDLVRIPLLLSLMAMLRMAFITMFYSNFKIRKISLKQAPGHNHENTIFEPGQ